MWSNYLNGDGYDLVLLGREDDSPINADRLQARLSNKEYSAVATSLAYVGFKSAMDLLTTYAGRASDLQPMLAGAQINKDMNMRLQILPGWDRIRLRRRSFTGRFCLTGSSPESADRLV